jgi:hypothetical protein
MYRNPLLARFPFLILLADYIENLGTLTMLSLFPQKLLILGTVSGLFTSLKWLLLMIMGVLLLYGLVFKIWKKRKQKNFRIYLPVSKLVW